MSIKESWESKGYIDPEEVTLPTEKRLEEAPFAVIECPQEIPCSPCRDSCPTGAIQMEDINSVPTIDHSKCTGCSICVQKCPGLAIFVLNCDENRAQITLPYEFTPLPKEGDKVAGLDRKGNKVCKAKVIQVVNKDQSVGDTSMVTIQLPGKYFNLVRNIGEINDGR